MKIKGIINTNEGDLWLMSDLHYNHENVIKFDHRPYENVKAMNEDIRETLENKLKPNDTLIDLGDLFWRSSIAEIKKVLDLCKVSRFYKCIGNHDKQKLYYNDPIVSSYFTALGDILEVGVEHEGKQYRMVLSHYPIISWNGKPRGVFMLHGHTHGNIDTLNNDSKDLRVDVGFYGELARSTGSFLINFKDVLEFMKKKAGTDNFKSYVLTNCKEL